MFNPERHRKHKLGGPAEGESQSFICGLYEIVSLTSSSFQARVHLLRSRCKSSVSSPRSFSSFPSAICLGSASVRFVLPPHVGMSVLLHFLNTPLGAGSEIILTNTQLGPLLSGCTLHLCSSLAWNLLLSGPHARANGGLRLFV